MKNSSKRRFVRNLFLGALFVLGSSLGAGSSALAEDAKPGGELVLGVGYSPPSLNPAVQSGFGAGCARHPDLRKPASL